ncbi:TPA: hypothetical protein DDZ10_02955 [Candidatus Uhrbacteria bacterium]|uniref:Uncharacterized protein n=1 Tax=Candidatus Uhrbacteria bacterium GW2011_GWC2_53_7 TaxID=1618986 RepID=A0A0G1XW93_9BACT|nr:MAG: hypothetical protein UY82_C0045G0010 [Candidatus Uhrbacteria bacterium GW2011_GWC2_53_7]OGL72789.1 MAG: hypothetical protein A3D69_03820 [Candidatus Uhrbacteria bacterium RIFCSPHIGHO2_02_FULL_54_11]HBL39607.1 hypothetical protein [Candidatus Uhrbacteria bacterium]
MGTAKKKTTTSTVKSKTQKPSVKKLTARTMAKRQVAKKKTALKKDEDLLTLHLHHEIPQLDPIVPCLPDMPEPPEPAEMGICKHCHLLPAAAYELVIVLTCLTFSLSAVLLTSTQTIERQQDVIATLQKVKMDVYVRR